MSRRCLLFSSFVKNVLTAVVFVLVIVFYIRYTGLAPAQCALEDGCVLSASSSLGVVSEELCPANQSCLLGYYSSEYGTCDYQALPNGTNCSSACYVDAAPTTCGTDGTCTGPSEDCRGTCTDDSNCTAAIPLEAYWVDESTQLYQYTHVCESSRCELHLLDVYYQTYGDYSHSPIAASVFCRDYLDLEWMEEHADCLISESFILDPNMTNAYPLSEEAEAVYTYRMCSFHYACAPLAEAEVKRSVYENRRIAIARELLLAWKHPHRE